MNNISDWTKKNLPSHWNFTVFDTINSTNTYIKENPQKISPPCLIMAIHQTQGRGRGTNIWHGSGQDYFLGSFALKLGVYKLDPRWTMALGYFVYESLSEAFPGLLFSIKAPNDIFLEEKKLSGLLVESFFYGDSLILILGLGVNIFSSPQDFPATHLSQFGEKNWEKDWGSFIKHLCKRLDNFENFVNNPKWLAIISDKLKGALNLNPHHKSNPIKNIREDGSLELHQGYLSWLEL